MHQIDKNGYYFEPEVNPKLIALMSFIMGIAVLYVPYKEYTRDLTRGISHDQAITNLIYAQTFICGNGITTMTQDTLNLFTLLAMTLATLLFVATIFLMGYKHYIKFNRSGFLEYSHSTFGWEYIRKNIQVESIREFYVLKRDIYSPRSVKKSSFFDIHMDFEPTDSKVMGIFIDEEKANKGCNDLKNMFKHLIKK